MMGNDVISSNQRAPYNAFVKPHAWTINDFQ